MSKATVESPPTADQPPPLAMPGVFRRPGIRLTTEFDSDTALFFHKVSCKVLDSVAKLKLTFQNNDRGEISDPQISLSSKYLSLSYDLEDHAAFVKSSVDLRPGLSFKASHAVKEQQGELAMVADLAGQDYKLELSTAVPFYGLPKATFKFPCGDVSLEEKDEEEEVKEKLSINGLVKGHLLNGFCSAHYNDESLNLKYKYKDEKMAFIPSISLPLNTVSFAFKRRFSPSDKLSYWYNFDSNDWSTVYKHTVGKDYKLKVGYDSNVRLGWASLWVGDELGRAKSAPMKTKIQFMLQVPQDDIASSALMFRVKKRWDI